MRFSSLLLFLLFSVTAQAQAIAIGYKYSPDEIAKARAVVSQKTDTPMGISVGGSYTTVELENAKKIIRESQPKALKLEVGEFEVIEPSKEAKQPLQFQHLSSKAFCLWKVKAGETFGLTGKRRGEKQRTQHRFEAKPYEWAIIEATPQGEKATETSGYVAINRNGKNKETDPPEEIDRILVVVGDEKPPPPPKPPEPDLTDFQKQLKAAGNTDIAAGKGTKEHAAMLASVYRSAAESPPSAGTIGTLYDTMRRAIESAGIPTPDKSLPSMRRLIETELNKRLPTDREKQVTLEDRNRITAAFNFIADSLEAVIK